MSLRHITSINDLTREEIETVFSRADAFLQELGDPKDPDRIGRSTDLCRGSIMATLFYEPSTRTRLSFESAMLRLGGNTISSADPATSSAAKGETLADTVRMSSAYADVLVIRHPREGAAKLAAQYASVPVINGGDGAHEHPTQTLCDLFAIRRAKGKLAELNVALLGDLKGGRTVHSLVYALARFGANVIAMPAGDMDLPEHVSWRLEHEFGCRRTTFEPPAGLNRGPHYAYLANNAEKNALERIDVLYVTRFQKERAGATAGHYPMVNADFLSAPIFREALVLHPLPRVGELDPALDMDPRAGYFRQASLGVPIRMALTALLSNAWPEQHFREHGAGTAQREPLADRGFLCPNANCITRDAQEAQNAAPPLLRVPSEPGRLRCYYCEHDIA